jgi:hypothetical protein
MNRTDVALCWNLELERARVQPSWPAGFVDRSSRVVHLDTLCLENRQRLNESHAPIRERGSDESKKNPADR